MSDENKTIEIKEIVEENKIIEVKESAKSKRTKRFKQDIEERNIKYIEELLEYTTFDQKYWEYDNKNNYHDIISDYLSKRNTTKEKIRTFLMSKLELENNNSWIYYFLSYFVLDDISKTDLEKSISLNNPYAMVRYCTYCLNVSEDLDKMLEYYKMAESLGYYRGFNGYMHTYYDQEVMEEKLTLANDKERNEFLDSLMPNLEKLVKIGKNDSYNTAAEIYQNLYLFSQGEDSKKYKEKFIIYKIKSGHGKDLFQDNEDDVLEYAEKYFELKNSYEAMIKVKEMDFSSIVSNDVGEFLKE